MFQVPFDDRDTSTVDTGRLIRFETTGQIYTVDEQQQDLCRRRQNKQSIFI